VTRAVAWAEHAPYGREVPLYSHENASLALVRVFLTERRYQQASQLLAALLGAAEQVMRMGSTIAILALHVAALQASGATHEALGVLDRLLTEAEPEGYLRVFLDAGELMHQALKAWLVIAHRQQHRVSPALVSYTQTLLDGFANEQHQHVGEETMVFGAPLLSHPPFQAVPPLPDPLTPREQEVLYLLAQGASNQEIANRLVVSLRTVKKHVGNLLLKLEAQNRTHAVARARELSLL
jgi:LuxR family maltose regulon positive regulatory protein